ncbi:MAG: NAD-dependent epimerase/dehydratase family protein [Acidobacteria bacterium]|nr:MAG: NAD-dependent epimerase/dehydratase family protein [Acidobacteriota bacterium]REK05629.1 MAG: NAD-dependent epimerase/dehydratase family protein [Acidobacteriota bacterium]
MKVLVTGAAGFVGARLVEHLLDAGDTVVATVQSAEQRDEATGALLASGEERASRCTVVAIDLVDPGQERQLARLQDESGCEVIVHLAAHSDVAASWNDVAGCYRVNVQGTENVLAAAGGARVVLASSAEVYGKVAPDQLPLHESAPVAPSTPYAMSKACAERLALRDGARVVRSFNLVGRGQSPRFAISSFAHQLRDIRRHGDRGVLRVGNLDSARDFLHVADGVAGYRTVAAAGEDGGVYNLASGEARRVREVLDRLIAITGLDVRVELDPRRLRPSDVPAMAGDSSRLERLGWQPHRSLDEALLELWNSLA